MLSSLNSLVTKRKTSLLLMALILKNMFRLDYLKRQTLTEVTQEIKKCNISKCNTSSTPDIISSLKSYIQTLESGINFIRRELQ